MKTLMNYLGAIIVLIAAVILVFIYIGGQGNNTAYGIILGSMLVGICIQVVLAYASND